MFTHIWATLTRRHSFKEFVFVHTIELVGMGCFIVFFYSATFIYSLFNWP